MILDTGFLVALDGGDTDAETTARELETRDVPMRVPTIVVQELYVAVGLGSEGRENAWKFESLLANSPVVSLDDRIARRAGVIEGRHIASDEKPDLGLADAIVAATALQFEEPVVTSDVSDFESVDGLDVITP
jgi:predicted nucleic acid-binding protein